MDSPTAIGGRLTFTAKTQQGSARVTGTLVAENIAVHRPVGQPSHFQPESKGNVWDLTQLSSGMRIGRFTTWEAAVFYGEQAAKASPALVAGKPLSQEQAAQLARLRQDCGGVN